MTNLQRKNLQRILVLTVMGLLFIPQPLLVVGTSSSNVSSNQAYIGPLLLEEMQSTQTSIPIIIHLNEGITDESVDWFINRQTSDNLGIRHVFYDLKMISAYATTSEIEQIASEENVAGLTLDKTWKIDDTPIETPVYEAKNDFEYINPDEYMYADDLWSQGYNGSGVVVAIIDSGVDPNHPDLAGRIIGFKDYIGNQEDLNPSDGIDAYDDDGHGTSCAWLVAGTGVESGGKFTGLAPGADLLIIKVLDSTGSGDDSVIAQGIQFAKNHGADIISLSLGGTWTDGVFPDPSIAACKDAIDAGVTVTIAAGNSGPAASTITSPGITEEAITVGSSVRNTSVVTFSSRGPVVRDITTPKGVFSKPDLLSPGREVISGRAQGANPLEYPVYDFIEYGSSYTSWSGTSASCPQIAGLAALLLDKYGPLEPLFVKAALMVSATDLGEDPMAQGWGLANVSKASEYLDGINPEITLITPNKYPTLPGGASIQIVGESREPSNITVISTETLGSVDIEMLGNATRFIQLREDSVTISKGYNYFSMGIAVPENTSTDDIGHYTGILNLKEGMNVITSMDLEILLTTYGGNLLVDMSHHDQTDPDYPDQYRYFQEYLKEQGMTLSEFGSPDTLTVERITSSDLELSEVFMIMDTELDYTTAEIDAIHQFVEEGGTLLILSEFYNSTTGVASFGLDTYNQILEPYGIQCEKNSIGIPINNLGVVYGPNTTGAVEPDNLTKGVNAIYVYAGSTFAVDDNLAEGLFWADNQKQHAILARAEYGKGLVIAISDGSTLYDDILFDAIQSGADNLQLLRNIAKEIVPNRPRLYSVDISLEKIGSPGNVTAYVFDENLVSVAMNITTPQGNIIQGDATSTLGYKFTRSFNVDAGGFYTISIEISDSEGNTRTLQRVVLVPVPPINDMFFLTVLWSLVAVVAVGLAYVGYIRFLGNRRKTRRRDDSSWEPEWESDKQPPSIE